MTVLPGNQSLLFPKPAVLQNWWVVFSWVISGGHIASGLEYWNFSVSTREVQGVLKTCNSRSSNFWTLIQPFPAKLCLLQRREKMGSKMRVALGLGSRIWAATRKWEDSFLWKGKTFQTWNSTAFQIAMKIKEMECRRLSFYFSRL